ncbi:MAG: glucosaminidase domain-containing protein [Bacteroidota bacterium]
MKLEINIGQCLSFVQKNWFKISLAVLGFYLFFIKQLSFQIQVLTPENTEQQQVKRKPIEKITDSKPAVASSSENTLDRLEIPFLKTTRKKKKKRDAIAELNTVNETTKHEYLQRFVKVAKAEQERFGIPASVILATALFQSTAGTRDMAVQANNHFALPCSDDWRSACKSYHGESMRKYDSAWSSYRDFSHFLDSNYSNLKGGNYINYANAFTNDGFGNDHRIGEQLIQIIEGYRLQELDN